MANEKMGIANRQAGVLAEANQEVNWYGINSLLNKTNTIRVSLSDIYINKHALSRAPKWLVGSYNRSIVMEGAKDYTSLMSK